MPTMRVLHLSDLHYGAGDDEAIERGAPVLVDRFDPELVIAGGDLILAGHIHQAAVSERREFEISTGGERGVVVSIAAGLGQPRPKRHGEARGVHVYEIDDACLRVHTFAWHRTDWGLTAERRFPRGREPLFSEPA